MIINYYIIKKSYSIVLTDGKEKSYITLSLDISKLFYEIDDEIFRFCTEGQVGNVDEVYTSDINKRHFNYQLAYRLKRLHYTSVSMHEDFKNKTI